MPQLQLPQLRELNEDVHKVPQNEMIQAIELPMPQEPEEEARDWAESALFEFVESEFKRLLEEKDQSVST